MRSFTEYLAESKKTYPFRIKVAGPVDAAVEKTLESLLSRYEVSGFKKTGSTPIQELPLDFPQIKNKEVNIYEVSLSYPTTPFELMEYLSSNLSIARDHLVVRSPGEPLEEYQTPTEKREGALLTDSEYKEAENANWDDFYGDKYNSGFVKELNDILKLQRKERGEVIPEEKSATFNSETAQNNTSPIKQSDYNPLRKK